MRHPFLAMRCPFLAMRCPFLAMRCPFLATRCPFLATRHLFLAIRCPFLAMRRVCLVTRPASVRHPDPKRATLPPFAEHRDALAAIPKGRREARCVLEATVQVFGSVGRVQEGVRRLRSPPSEAGFAPRSSGASDASPRGRKRSVKWEVEQAKTPVLVPRYTGGLRGTVPRVASDPLERPWISMTLNKSDSFGRGIGHNAAHEIELWFDYVSAFAYLGFQRICDLCARRDYRLVCTPAYLPALLEANRIRGSAEIESKRAYMFKHALRVAAENGLELDVPLRHPSLRSSRCGSPRFHRSAFAIGW
jgi:hypothetical protein